jgi:protein-S-isoprenylcysteine O-methyltransferase Ste14
MDDERDASVLRIFMSLTRVWLPLGIALGGVVLIVLGHGSYSELTNSRSLESAAGVSLLIVAIIVWMINWMFRLSVRSNQDRELEERAREYFDRTGRWPEDEPGDD